MKIAVILGAFSIGTRPIDFNNIWSNPRGLTGTDLCLIELSKGLSKLGNNVHILTVFGGVKPDTFEGMTLHHFADKNKVIDDSFDAVISINEPNILMDLPVRKLNVVYMMLNDFSFIQPGFDSYVDQYFGVCNQHTNHMKMQCPEPDKWQTIPLGCTPELYQDQRVPGRVLWCSSADRGLHWLLQSWSQIKAQVPQASLRILYHFNYGNIAKIEPLDTNYHAHVREMGQRIRYMQRAIQVLQPLGVEHIGSVSREQMVQEWNQASVFGFPCDTVAFSEGFSVSTLEAHASYTVPVISDVDCLGGIYKDSGAIVIPSPVQDHLEHFVNSMVRSLNDKVAADYIIKQCREFASEHTWTNTATQMHQYLQNTLACQNIRC